MQQVGLDNQVAPPAGGLVRRVRLRPSSGVHFVTQVATRKGGLFGDADPVVVARQRQFDGDSFDGDAVA